MLQYFDSIISDCLPSGDARVSVIFRLSCTGAGGVGLKNVCDCTPWPPDGTCVRGVAVEPGGC